MHLFIYNDPPGFFYTDPTRTKCIQSTTYTIPRHENVNKSSLPPPHPISEPLSLTPLNRSNSSKSAFFHIQCPPWVFLYQPPPQPNVSSQLLTPSPDTKMLYILLSPPHPISEPLSLTPLNRSNSSISAFFISNNPPWFFLYQPPPQPNISNQLPTPFPDTKMLFILLSLHPTQSLSHCP